MQTGGLGLQGSQTDFQGAKSINPTCAAACKEEQQLSVGGRCIGAAWRAKGQQPSRRCGDPAAEAGRQLWAAGATLLQLEQPRGSCLADAAGVLQQELSGSCQQVYTGLRGLREPRSSCLAAAAAMLHWKLSGGRQGLHCCGQESQEPAPDQALLEWCSVS